MKKVLASFAFVCLLSNALMAQKGYSGPRSLGVSFVLNDFLSAQRIRSSSLESVLRDKNWADFNEMEPGLGITYFKGLRKHIDFAGTLAASYVNYPLPNRPRASGDALLLAADASVNLKMFPDEYWVSPYLIAGVGAGKYKSNYAAFLPLGGGLRVNFFEEATLFVTTQYRIPVTADNAAYHFVYSVGISGVIGKK
ncbi:MAG TPA: hypothetical protein VFR58_00695 [Flavisolibacter sp.]|nr:hypothetical protein [Flavisolibacter sp.]